MDIKNKNNLSSFTPTRPLSHPLTFPPSHLPTFSPAHPLTRPPAHFLTCKGYTLIEVITVLAIIMALATTMGIALYDAHCKNLECLPIKCAIDQMKAIQDVIVKDFYPDIGRIPCAGEEPVFGIAYLCVEEKIDGVADWNKYYDYGWRGPYIKTIASLDATYFDPDSYPPDSNGNPVLFPAIAVPWAKNCEEKAREIEQDGSDADAYEACKEAWEKAGKGVPDLEECAMEYRKGKYYQILRPAQKCIEWETDRYGNFTGNCRKKAWEIPKKSACIVCRGQDCLPGYNVEYSTCESDCDKTYQEKAKKDCKSACREWYPWVLPDDPMIMQCVIECIKNPGEYLGNTTHAEWLDDCYFKCHAGTENLKIIDPDDPGYMDIGDDIIMFVFRGGLRSPLEK